MYNPVYIIFMNDDPRFVWIGDILDAKEKMEELAKEYWEMNKGTIKDNMCYALTGIITDPSNEAALYKNYLERYYWHIHDVNSNAQSPQDFTE